ncbi:hypothetical protein NCCP1664_01450 [Zafaria cholistanensis]|uniref:NlpC/P60 domain-containing protein n=1 Tax=Zafaria cholistanensis TaxID=1682741 RepID=A0A5A7NPE8_9MICC|nr:C40 family peptidase [Zafaria cholistanensis]GER21648.1 hypothetical protein NCCP1664_01450 [Zafaria cholistanensis]
MSYEAALERISSIQSRFAMAQTTGASIAGDAAARTAVSGTSSLESLASRLGMDTSGTSLESLSTLLGSEASRSSLFAQALDSASATSQAPSSTGDTAAGGAIVATAKKYLGVPYVWGGTDPDKGLDCSGLVQLVLGELGVDMPRVARDQAKEGALVASLAEARPGDLLGMRNGSHIAIYLGDNRILHAPQPGESVSIRSLTSADDIDTIRRVVPAAG